MKATGTTVKFDVGIGIFKPGGVVVFTDSMGVEHKRVVKRIDSSNTIWIKGSKLAEAADLLRNRFYFDLNWKEERNG